MSRTCSNSEVYEMMPQGNTINMQICKWYAMNNCILSKTFSDAEKQHKIENIHLLTNLLWRINF